MLPSELNASNGELLKEVVLRHPADWSLPPEFTQWLDDSTPFFNTLVDRVVPGYPTENADEHQARLGYRDRLMVTGELFHSWLVEDPEGKSTGLPLERAELSVKRFADVGPYRELKVCILNGVHTAIGVAALAASLQSVREMVEDDVFGPLSRNMLSEEVLPYRDAPDEEKHAYANQVLVRFANPAIRHYLYDISLNSIAKLSVRALPSLLAFYENRGHPPPVLCFALAALIAFYTAGYSGDRANESPPRASSAGLKKIASQGLPSSRSASPLPS